MMIALDDYPSLALFARVVHHRSFSGAAREASIAKSAVSRRVSRLEEKLGVRLLQRSTRSVTATEEGLRVYEHCVAIVAAGAAAEEAVGAEGEVRGTLRVNAPITFAQMHLGRALASFLEKNPGVDAHLSTDDRIVDVVEGGFDVVIRIGRLADSGLVARKLATDRLVVCASPAYLRAHGEPRSPEELVNHECLHYALVPRAAEWRFRGARGPLTIPTRGRLVATNGTVLREAALAGLGLVVLPSFMVAREIAAGELRLVLEGARRASIGIYAVTAHRTNAPARVRAFLGFAARYFRSPAWL
jgi:DNA-binding transcriptional LysR family regulator